MLNRCWFGSQGEGGLLFTQAFDRQAPHLTEPHSVTESRGPIDAVLLHGKLGALQIKRKPQEDPFSIICTRQLASLAFSGLFS